MKVSNGIGLIFSSFEDVLWLWIILTLPLGVAMMVLPFLPLSEEQALPARPDTHSGVVGLAV